MRRCRHDVLEPREDRSEEMHCSGWICRACNQAATGECHHQSWCRADFCGFDPLPREISQPALIGV